MNTISSDAIAVSLAVGLVGLGLAAACSSSPTKPDGDYKAVGGEGGRTAQGGSPTSGGKAPQGGSRAGDGGESAQSGGETQAGGRTGDGGEGGGPVATCKGTAEAGALYGLKYDGNALTTRLVRIDGLPSDPNVVSLGPDLPGFVGAIGFTKDGAILGADNRSSKLVRLCPEDGTSSVIAPWETEDFVVSDFALSPAGDVLVLGGVQTAHLMQIDPLTAKKVEDFGIIKPVDPNVPDWTDMTGVEFAKDGKLYGASLVGLYTIELDTLKATQVNSWKWEPDKQNPGWVLSFFRMTLTPEGLLRGLVQTDSFLSSEIWTWDPSKPETPPALVVESPSVLLDFATWPGLPQ